MTSYLWQKSSYCSEGDSCLHAAATPDSTIKLTESADPARVILSTTPTTWAAWLQAIKEGQNPAAGIEVEAVPCETTRIRSAAAPDEVVTTTHEK
ncbi:hypothetical protein GCM10020367_05770 [Streptomyces sannanensis]|uniref:DUF397 domain-containing protein n=1 Tax=Streptomyces sannanensis TaxID=285536 RepID=A0ABP6S4Y0_9ACTN